MQGYLITFFMAQDRRHRHRLLHEWLLEAATSIGVRGGTVLAAAEGVGHHGRRHSAHFFELADQPVEVQMAMTQDQSERLFGLLAQEGVKVFFVKTAVEFGITGAEA
jgi:PII-like signaling protein